MDDTRALIGNASELLFSRISAEFIKRLDNGERPCVDEYVHRYPQLAPTLRLVLGIVESFYVTSPQVCQQSQARSIEESLLVRLGDYQILREAGKGGMGVVYEAKQTSLDRRVALKVLPFISALDPRSLQRFRNEAHAIAMLHHPSIVPVYTIGCERGVHYFAMQYIEGQTLSQMILDLRKKYREVPQVGVFEDEDDRTSRFDCLLPYVPLETTLEINDSSIQEPPKPCDDREKADSQKPSCLVQFSIRDPEFFRYVARLGIQAAEALEHAHRQNVIHRDIKPANLLVDDAEHLWITDFGIAQVGTNRDLTITGDLIGTLRYMSPEQALGRVIIDQRTDVYSLGATLYELLTLVEVFEGNDREETLRQIAEREPRSMRHFNPAIPIDLETIILKSLAKQVDERYSTAQDLADDLKRFLRNEPIHAKRPTLLDRGWKWARRHPVGVTATAFVLLLSLVILGISNVLITVERNAKVAALSKARQAELKETERRFEAENERSRAEANFRKARDAVDRVFTLAAEKMMDTPHMEQIRRSLLEDALSYYEEFLKEKGNDPSVRYETARAYWRVGTICELLGRYDRAESTLKSGIELFTKLTSDFPLQREYSDDLLECYANYAYLMQQVHNRTSDQIATRRLILTLAEKRVADHPSVYAYVRRLASCLVDLANAYLERRPDEAERLCRRSIALYDKMKVDFPNEQEDLTGMAFSHHWLGSALFAQRRPEQAIVEFEKSATIREQLIDADPQNTGLQLQMAHLQGHLARAFELLEDLPAAEIAIQRAIRFHEKEMELAPSVPELSRRVAVYYENLGNIRSGQRRVAEAEEAYRKCLSIRTKLIDEFPGQLKAKYSLGWTHYQLGSLFYDSNQFYAALDEFRLAKAFFEDGVEQSPNESPQLNALAFILSDCPIEDLREPDRAITLVQRCLELAPTSSRYWSTLGLAKFRVGDWQGSIDAIQKSIEFSSSISGPSEWIGLAVAYWHLDQKTLAREWLNKAIVEMDKSKVHNRDLTRHRREAEALISMESGNPANVIEK